MSQYSNAGQTSNLYTNIGLHTNQVYTNYVIFDNRNVEFSRQNLLFIPMNTHLLTWHSRSPRFTTMEVHKDYFQQTYPSHNMKLAYYHV